MKRIICLILAVVMVSAVMSGCGKKSERVLYNVKLSKYINLGDYKNIKISKSSDDFKKEKADTISEDVKNNDFYVQKNEGTVADGDTVNIDYTGKKDGVAFDGGTAEAQDLTIGSNSFIDGFETGLIGKEIGSTVDLDLKFPDTYQNNPDLAGAAVVFTVKINYAKTTEEQSPKDFYSKLKFKSVDEYYKDIDEKAVKRVLLSKIKKASKVKDYPKDDLDLLYSSSKSMIEQNIKSSYNVDLKTYLEYVKQTENEFRESVIKEQVKPTMDSQMAVYSIFDKEKMSFTQDEISKEVDKVVKSVNNSQVTADVVKKYYGDYYFEYLVVSDKVMDYVYKNAKIS